MFDCLHFHLNIRQRTIRFNQNSPFGFFFLILLVFTPLFFSAIKFHTIHCSFVLCLPPFYLITFEHYPKFIHDNLFKNMNRTPFLLMFDNQFFTLPPSVEMSFPFFKRIYEFQHLLRETILRIEVNGEILHKFSIYLAPRVSNLGSLFFPLFQSTISECSCRPFSQF